jgi:5-(carboxyamino)imidazole ribonucleotide mutase
VADYGPPHSIALNIELPEYQLLQSAVSGASVLLASCWRLWDDEAERGEQADDLLRHLLGGPFGVPQDPIPVHPGQNLLWLPPPPPRLALHARFVYAAAFVASKVWAAILSLVEKPVAIIMGSESDWETMRHAAALLDELKIGFMALIVSAHRTPDRLVDFAKGAKAAGFKVVIAGAGGAAHLPGMTAAMTGLPVLGVPIDTTALGGQDSLFSIVQMPAGVPVGTLAIGKPGAINAALLAAAILALGDSTIDAKLTAWRAAQTEAVPKRPSRED